MFFLYIINHTYTPTIVFIVSRNLEEPTLPVYSAQGHKEIINTIDGVGGLGIGEGDACCTYNTICWLL